MTNLVEKCTPFCDFGMKSEVMIPTNIYDKFCDLMSSIMVFFAMCEYSSNYNGEYAAQGRVHIFKLFKEGKRAFSIEIYNNVDKYHSMLSVTISYHFHHDYSAIQYYKEVFDKSFKGLREDNFIRFETEDDLVDGLEKFITLI